MSTRIAAVVLLSKTVTTNGVYIRHQVTLVNVPYSHNENDVVETAIGRTVRNILAADMLPHTEAATVREYLCNNFDAHVHWSPE